MARKTTFFWISELIAKAGLLSLCIGFFTDYPPFQRSLSWVEGNRHIPIIKATVPESMAGIVGGVTVGGGLIFIAIGLWRRNSKLNRPIRCFFDEFGDAFISLVSSVLTTWAIVEPLKRFVGEPRPHFLARCYGGLDYIPDLVQIPEKMTNQMCWEIQPDQANMDWATFDKEMNEDRMSFPSAHSALMASIFLWMGLYAYNLGHLLNIPGYTGLGSMIMVMFICPTMYIATSRIRDQWHHPHDVLLGLMFGGLIAFWQYAMYFPTSIPRCNPCYDGDYLERREVHDETVNPTKRDGLTSGPEGSPYEYENEREMDYEA